MPEKTFLLPQDSLWSGNRFRDHLLADMILYLTCLSFIWLAGGALN